MKPIVVVAMLATFAIPVMLAAIVGCHKAPDELQAPMGTGVVEASPTNESTTPSTLASSPSSKKRPASCIAQTPEQAQGPVPEHARKCPPDIEGRAMLPVFSVKFDEAGGAVSAELARTHHDSEKGLMYRTEMSESEGMLFDLGERTVHRFWMHNTCIPLDMLFIDDDGTIVGIVENAPTLDDGERSVPCASSYVLEVNAGYTRRHGIRAGQHVTLPAH